MTAFTARRRPLAALVALGLAVVTAGVACSRDEGERAADGGGTSTTAAAPEQTTPTSAQPAVSKLPPPRQLDIQVKHANGTTLRVTEVSFHEDHIQLKGSATNGGQNDVELAAGGMVVRDDLGSTYNLSPPPHNPDLTVAKANTLQGSLVFLGRVAPRATTLTLTTNSRYGNDTSQYTRTPTMVVPNIPVGDPGGAGQQPGSAPTSSVPQAPPTSSFTS